MDLFQNRNISPMLIGASGDAFDSGDYLFELKLDGERCIAYLDPSGVQLRNKRNMRLNEKFPELADINRQISQRCILDGELFVMAGGKPDFYAVQRRLMMGNSFKISLEAAKLPATFTAFDILYAGDKQVTDLPLTERRKLLEKTVKENERISVSRCLEYNGIALFEAARQRGLEGVVAKRKDSRYYFDKRTKDWIKIKNLQDDDFVVCGYIDKAEHVSSLVLGQYRDGKLIYKGHVTLGVSGEGYQRILRAGKAGKHPFAQLPSGNEDAVWLEPELVCKVSYMERTGSGGIRHPVFKGLREDKAPQECQEPVESG